MVSSGRDSPLPFSSPQLKGCQPHPASCWLLYQDSKGKVDPGMDPDQVSSPVPQYLYHTAGGAGGYPAVAELAESLQVAVKRVANPSQLVAFLPLHCKMPGS